MAGAVRIPQYAPQVGTPNGRIAGAEGNVPRSYHMDLSGFDSLRQHMAAKAEETEANNAKADIAAEEPRAQLALATAFDNIQRTWTPGSRPVAEQMFEAIDTYRTDAEKRFANPKTRELLAERANEFKTHYGVQGFAWQQKTEVDNRVTTYENTYRDIGNVGAKNPAQFGQQLAIANATVMADSQLPQQAKAEFVRKQSQAAALVVAKAQADLSPAQVVAYTGALLGITEPTLTMPKGSNITTEIVKRESGGRLYGGDGKILRGPAITTKDGGTVHAYGPYQLLEGTAKAQAQELGVPWKPEVFFRDKTGDVRQDEETRQYHDLLGQSYIQTQEALFGGNPVLVAAAHNMGPEATKGWAAGRPYQTQSGKWWYPQKPMDMSALPAETRKYVEGLGVTEEPVAATVRTDGEDATAYRMLDTDSLLAVRGIAMSNLAELQRQKAEALKVQADLFKQRVDDIETAAKHGDPIEVPSDGELTAYLGPAQAALTKQRLLNYQQMAKGLKALPGLSNDELQAVANAPDPDGTEDRENRQFVRDSMATEASRVLAARKADPGQAAIEGSSVVRDTYAAWGAKAAEFYAAGAQATPEQFDAMAKAQADFVRVAFAQQKVWGFTQPQLPKAVTDKMAEGFRVQMERDPVQAAAYIARLPDLLGSDEAVAQVGNKIGTLAWLAMDGVPGLTLAKLQAERKIPEAKRSELLPAGITKADIETEVRAAFDPLLSTLAYQNDTVTAERYRDAGVTLTMERLTRAGGSAKEAARAAYAELFGDRHAVNGTYRIDTQRYDADAVGRRLEQIRATLDPARLQVAPEPGFSLEESQQRAARTVRAKAFWVNNAAGTGVYLMHAHGPVLDASGKPIEVAFDQAAKSAPPATAAAVDSAFRAAKGF